MLSALVLNASFEPLSIVSAQRATCLVLADKADVLEDDQPKRRLIDTLPDMVDALLQSPAEWYERHGLALPKDLPSPMRSKAS